jgi:hypothetical protein
MKIKRIIFRLQELFRRKPCCQYQRSGNNSIQIQVASLCTTSSSAPDINFQFCKKSANSEVNPGKSIPFPIHSAIIDALDHAKTKHPKFANTDAEAGTVIAEELLEVNTAALKVMQCINDQADRDNLFVELAQLNATTIRMMEKLLK